MLTYLLTFDSSSVAMNSAIPKMLVTGGGDDVALMWDISNGTGLCKLAGHTGQTNTCTLLHIHSFFFFEIFLSLDSIAAVGFNFDGKLVATAGLEGAVKTWSTDNGTF
jgi:angio-associated migratory cell protein